jgi:sn-glycerol 3-phosphate transport system substrate-binding protein
MRYRPFRWLALATVSFFAFAQAQEPIRITYWRSLAGPRGEAQEELVRRFNASQEDIVVDVQFQGSYSELEQNLLAALAARQLPEVVMLCDTCMPAFARDGVLAPLDSFLDGDAEVSREAFVGDILAGGVVDEQLYLIPFAASTPILFVNPELMAEYGYDAPPETWDDFFAMASDIYEQSGGEVWGASVSPSSWWLQAHIWALGGEFSDSTWNTYVDSSEWVEALTRWRDSIHGDGSIRVPVGEEGSTFEDFANARAAMIISSTANITSTFEQVSGFVPDTAFMPAGPAGRIVPTGGAGLGIVAGLDEEVEAAAWEFIKFMTSPEANAFFAQETGYMPYTEGAIAMMEDFLVENPEWRTSIEQLQFARNQSELNGTREARAELNEALERIFIGGEDPAVILPAAQEAVQAALQLEGLR